jgi:hypothetical protein
MSWTVVRPRRPQDKHRVILNTKWEVTQAVWDADKSLWIMSGQSEEQKQIALHHGWREELKEETCQPFAALLEGTVDQIRDELPNMILDAELLDQIEAEEKAGQNRKGVKKAIEQARRSLQ